MSYEFLIALAIGFITWFILNLLHSYNRLKKGISFKESLDLTNLPIVSFKNNDVTLNFLLDTGSDSAYINKSILPQLDYEFTDSKTQMFGIDGNFVENEICSMIISYKDYKFESRFNVHDMDAPFNQIKESTGVQIHGILGSNFFRRYKYILDFEKLIAVIK